MSTPIDATSDAERTAPSPRRRPRDRAEQILRAASDPIVARGFHDVTMEEIADAAGITARALYRHYANKQSLLAAVIAQGQDLYTTNTQSSFDGALPRLVDDAIATRDLTVLWQREARYLDDADRRRVRARIGAIVDGIETSLTLERPLEQRSVVHLRAWAIASVLTSLGLHSHSLTSGASRTAVERACRAVANAPLDTDCPPNPSVDPTASASDELPRREAILMEGAHLFAHQGYSAVSTGQIGRSTGIAGSGIYRHFGSKQEILDAVIMRSEEWEALEHTRTARRTTDPTKRLIGWVSGVTRLALDDPDLFAVRLTDIGHASPEVAASARRSRTDRDAAWVAAIGARGGTSTAPIRRSAADIVVAAARAVVTDLARTPHLRSQRGLAHNIELLALAVIDIRPTSTEK